MLNVPQLMKQSKSISITDPGMINRFTDDPDFPYLVSFPRTGSHWLRMIMELYFGKPSLVRIFYFRDAKDFSCYHTHDLELDVERRNVIYLFREPVATIYSQLSYHRENPDDRSRIENWARLYGKHLEKWLISENFTGKKTILTYEGMKSNMDGEFRKVCEHFEWPFDDNRLKEVRARVSKKEVRKRTKHDSQVVNLKKAYDAARKEFTARHGDFIWGIINEIDGIGKFFG